MVFISGLFLTILSGVLNGSFAVPIKKIDDWEWENTWLIYALLGMIGLPLLITVFFLPDVLNVYSGVSPSCLLSVSLFGCGWGVGSLLFGLAIRLVGISVGFTVVVGGIAVFGSLLPFLVDNGSSFFSSQGISILISLLATTIGVIFCGTASKLRNADSISNGKVKITAAKFRLGLLLCVIAALLSSMLNFAFYFGVPISAAARQYLGDRSTSFLINHPIWVITLGAGFLPYLIYCSFLLIKNKTFTNYYATNGSSANWFYASLMALLWFLCIIFYGIGVEKLGATGTSLGWLLLMAITVITGNIWGFLTNEWNGTSLRARNLMFIGIMFLVGNIFIIGLPKIFGWY